MRASSPFCSEIKERAKTAKAEKATKKASDSKAKVLLQKCWFLIALTRTCSQFFSQPINE